MENIKEFLKAYQNKEFKKRNGRVSSNNLEMMMKHHSFNKTVKFLSDEYKKGYGFKSLIKINELPVSYTKLKFLFDIIGINRNHGCRVVTDKVREFRCEKAKNEFKNKIGFFKEGVQEKIKIRNKTSRGIQGYYYNESQCKYVWLRSSWEYIYAKWLDSKYIIWDVEVKSYTLDSGYKYRPDFFIKNDSDEYNTIVEVKGYWKDKIWKYVELKKKLVKVEFSLITDIKPFLIGESSLKVEIENWKKIREINKEYINENKKN